MHKNSKWAKQIIALQEPDGKWGWFHSLSKSYGAPMTTEMALGRLKRLGFTMNDPCIQKAVSYMNDCLLKKKEIPDRREKLHDWDIFTSLLLATRIREFTFDNPAANIIALQWTNVVTAAFTSGAYNHRDYVAAYTDILGMKPKGGRLVDFTNYYPLSLLNGCLDEATQQAMVHHVLHKRDGIYYVYEASLLALPETFASRETSRYLAAMELLAQYPAAREQLHFVIDWLNTNKNESGKWDLGPSVNDKVYFPLSDSWRKQGTREADCTERIAKLIALISSS